MSLLDKLKSMFSPGSPDAGVRPAAEPDAATALDDPIPPAEQKPPQEDEDRLE